MKKQSIMMSVLMGVTLSFCLSLIGNLTSGHFTAIGFIVSFIASTVISLIIGYFVPMRKVGSAACRKLGAEEGSLSWKLIECLISDLIYTPVITLSMVALASVMSHGKMAFLPAFLHSLLISMIAGYVLIYIFTPIYLRLVMKNSGGRPEEQERSGRS